tara:strand:+ start:18321 stop:18563 length:243 start_codon:yes stop_codon:yes gene_type:complete
MSILYLVTKPFFIFGDLWEVCDGDFVVAMQDGVFAPPEGIDKLALCGPDANIRNIKSDKPRITYDDIIKMVKEHDKVVTL